jgi:hypothetical protein
MMVAVRFLAPGLGLAAGYALAVRPRLVRWGATDEEVRRPYPGADLIPGGERSATMAVTIEAEPSRLWPWLVQMGTDRAGWYSWDRLDNGGAQSSWEIDPAWQEIELEDRFLSRPGGESWFEVAALEPERFLGLRASLDLRGRPFDPKGPRPRVFSDSLWCFLLEETPDGGTRMINSGYAAANPRTLARAGDAFFWEPAHWIMQTRQWSGLRKRVEEGRVRVQLGVNV